MGFPEIAPGDFLGDLIFNKCLDNGLTFIDSDLVVIAQKVVSKAEGAYVELKHQNPSVEALKLSETVGKDPRLIQIILDQSKRVVRAAPGVLIVETVHGFICANAGIDQSNVNGSDLVTTLPVDADKSARAILDTLISHTGVNIGVVISDTFNRPWREGSINVAIGVAGLDPIRDLRGTIDDHGRVMMTSKVSLADQVCSAAQLVMGESGGIPVALVRGVDWDAGDHSSVELIRPPSRDLFR